MTRLLCTRKIGLGVQQIHGSRPERSIKPGCWLFFEDGPFPGYISPELAYPRLFIFRVYPTAAIRGKRHVALQPMAAGLKYGAKAD